MAGGITRWLNSFGGGGKPRQTDEYLIDTATLFYLVDTDGSDYLIGS